MSLKRLTVVALVAFCIFVEPAGGARERIVGDPWAYLRQQSGNPRRPFL